METITKHQPSTHIKNLIMIKQFSILAITSICFNSCAVLFTPPAEPTSFLRKKDGTAINANINSNGPVMSVNASITKPISDVVSINGSASVGVYGIDVFTESPFQGENKQNNVAVNLGINTTKLTAYPMMLWIGGQYGNSSTAYAQNIFVPAFSKDTFSVISATSATRYEKLNGNYMALRLGVNHVILSNYDNNIEKKDKKKVAVDLTGTAYLNIVKYNYDNSLNFNNRYNELLGYALAFTKSKNNTRIGFKLDFMKPLIQLSNDIRGIPTDPWHPGFSEIPFVSPSISYTRLIKPLKYKW